MVINSIVLINICVFICSHFFHKNMLIDYGLNIFTINNTFMYVSNMFLHAGYLHIIMNMIFLVQVGRIIERVYGRQSLMILYFTSGISSSVCSAVIIWWLPMALGINDFAYVTVVGASGAIFGLFAFISYMANNLKSFFTQVIIFHLIVFMLHLPVAWQAHLGGLLAGLLIARFTKFGGFSKFRRI